MKEIHIDIGGRIETIHIDTAMDGIGRNCIICGHMFSIPVPEDPRTICPDCCAAIVKVKTNGKCNWVANSKGGEPNHR